MFHLANLVTTCSRRPASSHGLGGLDEPASACKCGRVGALKNSNKSSTGPLVTVRSGRSFCFATLCARAGVTKCAELAADAYPASSPRRGFPGVPPQTPPGPGRTAGARGLTCLKQKGMVRTLTPTMLFTMFMISPQLEAAAAVIARALGPGSPGVRRRDHRGARGPDRHGRLPGGGGLAGRRRGPSACRHRQAPRPPHDSVSGSLTPADRLRVPAPGPGRDASCQLGTPQPGFGTARGRTLPPSVGPSSRK